MTDLARPAADELPAVKWMARYLMLRPGDLVTWTLNGRYTTDGSAHLVSATPSAAHVLSPTMPSANKP